MTVKWKFLAPILGSAWLIVAIAATALNGGAQFDIVRSELVYTNTNTEKENNTPLAIKNVGKIGNRPTSNERIALLGQRAISEKYHHHQKGTSRTSSGKERKAQTYQPTDSASANRQGQRCSGVCRFIPDRDYCPITVIEEYEGDDYYNEDEDYYDDEDDDYYNEGSIEEKEPDSSAKRDPLKSEKRLHVVYPAITKFSITQSGHSHQKSQRKIKKATLKSNRQPSLTIKREQRRNRQPNQEGHRESSLSALEQEETPERWDRVVERGPFIGGDIVEHPVKIPEGVLLRPGNFRGFRRYWPKGVIPFTMDSSLNTCREDVIFDAMDEIEGKTCIKFVERDNERNYIDIRRTSVGCSSYVGMIGGVQHLNLSTGCFSKFTVTHELLHAIGFDHEQSRKDRNKFIEVDFDNVLNEKEGQFELNPTHTGSGFPYDIRSIMHYSAFLFAKDKCEPTIYPLDDDVDICELGSGNGNGGMTNCDAAKINKLYKCNKKYSRRCKAKKKTK